MVAGSWLRRDVVLLSSVTNTQVSVAPTSTPKAVFRSLFSKEEHEKFMEKGERRISHTATLGAMLIFLNR